MLVPGGSAHRPEKRWPVEKYGELARILYARGLDIVVIGGPQETALAQAIQRQVPRARDLTGRTDFARIAVLGAKRRAGRRQRHRPAAPGRRGRRADPGAVLQASDPALSAPRGQVAVLQAAEAVGTACGRKWRRRPAALLPARPGARLIARRALDHILSQADRSASDARPALATP